MLQRDYIMRLVRQFIEALEKLVEEKNVDCYIAYFGIRWIG